MEEKNNNYKILIVDDSSMNRAILSDILGDKFSILEAEDGIEAINLIRKYNQEISLILLDLVMPNMDGLEVLAVMHKHDWIDTMPVIMISSENSPSYIERAYEMGVTDFINRPFNVSIVRKRVANTIMLYAKQKSLINLVNQQIYEREKQSDIMINILSHIVEFRNGESGLHILHVNTITEILLKQLIKKTDKYSLTSSDIETIVIASSLHDIGKISVPDEILNKPGRLTPEEFEIIKGHSKAGADMLNALTEYADEPLVKVASEICLYHHERYDGKGYPTGKSGDDIPISAQVVAMADVYDALTSDRCYKNAIPHSKALEMIKNGECGCFNPLLLECLDEMGDFIEKRLKIKSAKKNMYKIKAVADEMLRQNSVSSSNSTINFLEQERIKNELFASLSQEIQFEYTSSPAVITISEWCANQLGLPQVIVNPFENEKLLSVIGGIGTIDIFKEELIKTSITNPVTQFVVLIKNDTGLRHNKVHCRVNWSDEDKPEIVSVIGKITDIEDEYQKILNLEKSASTDTLTRLYNRGYAEAIINKLLENREKIYTLMLFDVDNFKTANDTYGHLFGDEILKEIAATLKRCSADKSSIVARLGGDEFLMFIDYINEAETLDLIDSIYNTLSSIKRKDYSVSLSLGIASTDKVGYEYNHLFSCADSALYYSKRSGKGIYTFYDETLDASNTEITPIEN